MSLKTHWADGSVEIAILAGGLSRRMGRDKLRLRLGGRTVLGHAEALAASLDLPVRVIRRDLVPRCGPLGGIYTALKQARRSAVLILSGDMPFVSRGVVQTLAASARPEDTAVFAHSERGFGFPALLATESLPVVESLMADGRLSIQALAHTLKARPFDPPKGLAGDLFNLNTPEDLDSARARLPSPDASRPAARLPSKLDSPLRLPLVSRPLMAAKKPKPLVGIIMGSRSDWETMQHCAAQLEALGVPHESKAMSAHRTPDLVEDYVGNARKRGLEVIIAAAGGAAHLAGVAAAKTSLPVLGVPMQAWSLDGLDSLLSMVQMPRGIPVATLAIGKAGAVNAALFATSILAGKYPEYRKAYEKFRRDQTRAGEKGQDLP